MNRHYIFRGHKIVRCYQKVHWLRRIREKRTGLFYSDGRCVPLLPDLLHNSWDVLSISTWPIQTGSVKGMVYFYVASERGVACFFLFFVCLFFCFFFQNVLREFKYFIKRQSECIVKGTVTI